MNTSDIFCDSEFANSSNFSCVNRTVPSYSIIDIASFMHIFPTIYGILCSVGVLANSLVIYAVAACKKKMVSDIYVLNLAIADLLFLLVMPFNIHQLVRDRQWVFGHFMCKAVVVVDVSNQFTTVGIVTVLCIDRWELHAFGRIPEYLCSDRNAVNCYCWTHFVYLSCKVGLTILERVVLHTFYTPISKTWIF